MIDRFCSIKSRNNQSEHSWGKRACNAAKRVVGALDYCIETYVVIHVCGRYPLPTTVPKVLGCVIADYSSQGNVETTRNPERPPCFLSTPVNGVYHDKTSDALLSGMNRWAGAGGCLLALIENAAAHSGYPLHY